MLAVDEAPAFDHIEAAGGRAVVVVCDHARNRVPRALGTLGLDERRLSGHIAWDIGAGDVARRIAESLGASAVLGGYSRLVVDLNRSLRDASAFPAISDGVLIPGNLDLDAAEKAERARAVFEPYHQAVRGALAARSTAGIAPVLIGVHSFTPRMHGVERPWHVGVLWDKDPRLPLRLLALLRRVAGLVVGDNEPYSGRHPADFTMDHHAEPLGLAHAGIEIRQDLIRDDAGRAEWAGRLSEVLARVLEDDVLYRRGGDSRGAAGPRGR